MAELQPVPNAPSPVAGREGAVAVLLGIALLLVIVKPWGSAADRAEPSASPFPSHTAAPSASADTASVLEVDLFGPFEPTPEWSIWPAGYFVSVMYVARAPRTEAQPSLAPSATSPPGADWPARIEVGEQDHLLWLGIDTPRGFKLETATLRRAGRREKEPGQLRPFRHLRLRTWWTDQIADGGVGNDRVAAEIGHAAHRKRVARITFEIVDLESGFITPRIE